jgi:hypothetical protein
MTTNFEQEVIEDLKRRKEALRRHLLNMPLTEKILATENMQRRNYAILKELEKNGGRKVPEILEKWRSAQVFLVLSSSLK